MPGWASRAPEPQPRDGVIVTRVVVPHCIARRHALLALAAACSALGARAQSDFPSRPLKLIVPQPPGGGFDFVGRTLAEALARQLGQSVVVENRPGSGTLVGTDAAAKAPPDGHALLVGSVSNLVLNVDRKSTRLNSSHLGISYAV